MQRKNSILKASRDGMAMIMAIAVIVVIATILALSLMLSAQTTKSTADTYLYEQSNLLARSAFEYAKLRIGLLNSPVARCNYTNENFVENNIYNIAININYIYNNALDPAPQCAQIDLVQNDNFGAALVEVTVTVNDPTVTTENIRVFQRKLIEF
jgi:Tfp pilus assembly protein PilX